MYASIKHFVNSLQLNNTILIVIVCTILANKYVATVVLLAT